MTLYLRFLWNMARRARFWAVCLAVWAVWYHYERQMEQTLADDVYRGDIAEVRRLTKMGVHPSEDSVLWACQLEQVEVVRLLLNAGGDPNATADNSETALTWAASHGHIEVVRLLLERGADPSRGSLELTPIKAADGRFPEIVALLKKAGERE